VRIIDIGERAQESGYNGTTKIKARVEHFLKPHIACPIPGHFIDPYNFQANIFWRDGPFNTRISQQI
jgi:hypothetical protein